jgi:hypothetical protein
MRLEGTPSDHLPDVLATGTTDVGYAFVSFSGREPNGRDADYVAWHSLDHRPEQYRLRGMRHSLRLVSTPSCRAARAASVGPFDAVDHVMTYLFANADSMAAFGALGGALDRAGRMPLRLPSLGYFTANIAGKCAADNAVAGADVIPWRPALGVYLIIEQGLASPETLVKTPGVAGIWWFSGAQAPPAFRADSRGRQITFCFLDEDPVHVAASLRTAVEARWKAGAVHGLLAAPFYVIVPYAWDLHLP